MSSKSKATKKKINPKTHNQDGSPKPPPTGKVITADVAVGAAPASATINQAPASMPPFFCEERTHHRIETTAEGQQTTRRTIIEYHVTKGEPVEGFRRFHGVGVLVANLPTGQTVRKDYHFLIVGNDIDEAWDNFEECLERGSKEATANFEAEYRAQMEAQQNRLVVPGAQGAQGLVGPGGAPLRQPGA